MISIRATAPAGRRKSRSHVVAMLASVSSIPDGAAESPASQLNPIVSIHRPAGSIPYTGSVDPLGTAMRHLRKFILFTGALLCFLIAAAFVLSRWWCVWVNVPIPGGPTQSVLVIAGGCVVESVRADGERSLFGFQETVPGYTATEWQLWNHWEAADSGVVFPLYVLLLAGAIPTLLVSRFAPKFPRGHCQRCGYNLQGLTEPRCPECGESFQHK